MLTEPILIQVEEITSQLNEIILNEEVVPNVFYAVWATAQGVPISYTNSLMTKLSEAGVKLFNDRKSYPSLKHKLFKLTLPEGWDK